MDNISTSNPDLFLINPDIERDAPLSVKWLEGDIGRQTLRLMGNKNEQNKPSTLEDEKRRIKDFVESTNQINWMLQFKDKIVGTIWVDKEPTDYLLAPAIHIMIGDPLQRGKGIGRCAYEAVVNYLKDEGSSDYLFSRHLTYNRPIANLLLGAGFEKHGEQYTDSDGLEWQNVRLSLKQ